MAIKRVKPKVHGDMPEANIQGRGKIVHVVFEYISRSLLWKKGVGMG
jgi:hypothetical protein